MKTRDEPAPPDDFDIDRETLAYIILKARAFDALVAPDDPSDASDAVDDRFVDVLEDEPDNPVQRELRAAIAGLDVDAKTTLVALAWLGRGDFEPSDWREAVSAARARAEGSAARYLMGLPLLGDYLAEGANALGISVTDEEVLGLQNPDLGARGGA
jgi:hypothetical protein